VRLPEFFDFARRRHQITLLKAAGQPRPWTDDPILNSFRFTNVYRELDKTTVWFRQHVRDPLREDPRVLIATIAFRWFNRIRTGQILMGCADQFMDDDLFADWDSDKARARLQHISPVVTAAYIIKTPNGMNKLDGVLWCIEQCVSQNETLYRAMDGSSLEQAHRILCEMPYMGPFMAYEVITDLRHTHMLRDAPDIMTWANPGPGARRGLSRLMEKDKDHFRSTPGHKLQEMMQEILVASQNDEEWPGQYPPWEMREVEHLLCEWDKYERARTGEGRPKQRY